MAWVRRMEVLHCLRDHCLPRNCSLAFRRMEAWVASRGIRPMACLRHRHLRHLQVRARPQVQAASMKRVLPSWISFVQETPLRSDANQLLANPE